MTRHPRPRYNCPWLTATIRAVRPCQFRPLGSAPSSWGDEENPGNPYEKWWILGPFTCYDPTKSYDQWGYNIGFFLCPNLEQLGSKQENWRSLVRLLDYPWIGLFGKKKHWVLHTVILPPEQKQIPLGGCSGVEDEASNLRRLLHLGVAWCVQNGREGLFADPIFSRHQMTSTLSCPQLHASCLKHTSMFIMCQFQFQNHRVLFSGIKLVRSVKGQWVPSKAVSSRSCRSLHSAHSAALGSENPPWPEVRWIHDTDTVDVETSAILYINTYSTLW
jgi:hypothetical protein